MISLFKQEAKMSECEADLKRFRVLKHRMESVQLEIFKALQVHTELMTSTKTAYVKKVLSLKR